MIRTTTEWIPRNAEHWLGQVARQRPVLVLTGARQTGKTSLLRRVFPDHRYVTLDIPSEAAEAEHEPASFLARHPGPLVIDEVQYAPGLFRHLKVAVDERRHESGRFILTGSQKFTLMRDVSDSLAGRAAIVGLEGLSLGELRRAGRPVDPVALMCRGTLPELWEKPDLDASLFWSSYVATYLERDLRDLLAVGNLRDFDRFLRAVALRSGNLLNKAELARDVGVAPSTAAAWLSVLEASNQVALLEPWFSNRTSTLVKSPKLYLSDPGLQAWLVGVRDGVDVFTTPFVGALFESLVASELRKSLMDRRRVGDLYFWRDRTREVDFVLHRAGRFELFEAKATESPGARDAAGIVHARGHLGADAVERAAVVCRAPAPHPLASGVTAIPLDTLSDEGG
jgi:predicted AAA+ superfamily ATPase